MKPYYFFLAFLFFLACNPDFHKVDEQLVDNERKEKAREYALELIKSFEAGKFDKIDRYGTEYMKEMMTPARQDSIYELINAEYGKFVSMEYVSAWAEEKKSLTAFRFRGEFEKTDNRPEIRIMLSSEDSLDGFWIRPWKESLGKWR